MWAITPPDFIHFRFFEFLKFRSAWGSLGWAVLYLLLCHLSVEGQETFVVETGKTYSYTEFDGYSNVELAGGTVTADISAETPISPHFTANENTSSSFDIKTSHLRLDGTLAGNGTITKEGDGQLHFYGDTSAFSGTIQVNSGWISIRRPVAASKQATYEINGNRGGMVLMPANSTEVFSLGMLTGNSTVRPGSYVASNTILQLRVGETNMSGTFSGSIQNVANDKTVAVEKAGTGTWILTGANGYTGATKVTGGTLQIGNGGSTGSLASAITVSGGSLVLNQATAADNSNWVWNNSLTLNGGTLENAGTRQVRWAGNMTFQGNNAIRISGGNFLFSGAMNLENGTTTFHAAEDIEDRNPVLSGKVTGAGIFRFEEHTATGQQLHFTGDLSEFKGRIEIASGKGFIGIFQTDLQGTTLHSEGGNVFFQAAKMEDTTYKIGNLSSGTTAGEFRAGSSSVNAPITLETGYANTNATFAGILKDQDSTKTIAITKVGTGTWTLTGANTYTGATKVMGGTLQLGNADSQGTLVSQTAITVSGGTLAMNNTNGSWSNSLTLDGGTLVNNMSEKVLTWTGGITLTGENTIRAAVNNIVLSGPINLQSGTTTIYSANNRPTISGKVTGEGTFRYDGHTVAGNQTYFTGDLSEFKGRIEITSGGGYIGIFTTALAGTTLHSDGGNVFFQNPSTTDTVYKIGNLSTGTTGGEFRSGTNSQGSSQTLETGYANTDATFSGLLRDYHENSKTLAVTKVGTGTWTVNGEQTYSGNTTVAEGTLNLMGALTNSNVTVKTGAALSGTGSITKDLTFEADSILRVTEPTERFQVVGNFSIDDLLTIDFQFDDYLSYKGTQLTFLETSNTAQNWLSSMEFDFSDIGGASIWNYGFTDGAYWIQIDNAAVPEPASWLLVLLGIPGVVCLIRRKQRKI